jgi:plastocyanin
MGSSRTEARSRSEHRAGSSPARFAALLGLVGAVALFAPSVASAAACSPTATSGTQTTYSCDIPTGTIGGYEVRQWVALAPTPPLDGYITHMETDIIDADTGQQVPISRLMLHHIVFVNVSRRDSTCGSFVGFDGRDSFGSFAPQRFYAAGEERAKMSLPAGYGYRTEGTDLWGVVAMVMNHRASADRAVIHYEVTIDTNPLTAVKPYWLDARDCRADPIYNVPGVAPKVKQKQKQKRAGKKALATGKNKRGKAKMKKGWSSRPTMTETRDYVFPESGRIVGGGGHVHGGAFGLRLTEPGCGNRQVAGSEPTWGLPDHPFYNVRPVLHEPGPINMSAFRSTTGLPVQAGETIRLNSIYDNSLPHVRVMGIMIVYLAPDPSVTQPCGPIPDWEIFKTEQPGRPGPIPFTIPLTGLDASGQAVTIDAPPGPLQNASSGTIVPVGDRFFGAPNLRVRRGSSITWQFSGQELHNLTLASGPLGIGSDNLDGDRTFTQQFTRPGTYRFFCGLHPTQMQQRVVVKDKKKRKKRHKKR